MAIKQFADTSAVSIAYAVDAAADASELTATTFNYIPYTSEGFQLAKESKISTAITADRRVSGSKNTRGSASGAASIEFGYTPFVLDMLELALMGEWTVDSVAADGSRFLIDGETQNFFVVEKRIRNTVGGVKTNFFERYYGNLVNELTMEIGSSELIGMSLSTMAVFGDTANADASADADAGGLATTYAAPASYEIADATNNIQNVVIKDALGDPMEVTFSDLSLTIGNNVREQMAVGHEFAAGMGMGKVNVQLSGTVYFFDDTVLKSHLENDTMSAEITVNTAEGNFVIHLPALKAEAPNANSQGENQDYSQSMTLNAEKGTVTLDGTAQTCVIAIVELAA